MNQNPCCDDVKDTKNESHSQLRAAGQLIAQPVVTMSKILKMKAIHNILHQVDGLVKPVVTMSKILKMKAIHNMLRIG